MTIQLNLTEEQFNLIWNIMNDDDIMDDALTDETDVQVWNELINVMEEVTEEIEEVEFALN